MRIAALLISLVAAGCSSATEPLYAELPDDKSEEGVVGIDYIKSLATGRSTVINKDILIEGFVVANDFRGEFYKKIVVDDGSGGIEVDIDQLNLYRTIPLHSCLSISCNGLAIGHTGGKYTLGAPPTGEYATDRIAAADIERYMNITENLQLPEPVELTVGELAVEHISRYVCIRGLTIAAQEEGAPWCEEAETGEDEGENGDSELYLTYTDRHFTDVRGDTLTVRTLNRCDYRNERIPSGSLSLAGIVDYADGRYMLRITNHRIMNY